VLHPTRVDQKGVHRAAVTDEKQFVTRDDNSQHPHPLATAAGAAQVTVHQVLVQ
jgi:hypothetical protein